MCKKKSKLQLAQEETQAAIDKVNKRIERLGENTSDLYQSLTEIQSIFDRIRNVPSDQRLKYEELKKVRLNWKKQAEKIEEDYKKAAAKGVGAGAAGAGLGVAVVALGPTAAMGVATTFGVASTGTAIAALHGAAATNAALAWLGGGALSLGGGGMAAGEAFLAMAGPIGWAIAGAALLSSGLLFWKANADKKRIDNIFTLISKRDVKSYSLAVVELEERIDRIKDESGKLNEAITIIRTFGTDYEKMSEAQQYELGGYLNLMLSSTQLLTNPILGLQPKYTEKDFQQFCSKNQMKELLEYPVCRNVVVSLANLLYKIDLDSKDRKVLWKTLRKNKNMLKAFDMKKKDFDYSFFEITSMALEYKYNN